MADFILLILGHNFKNLALIEYFRIHLAILKKKKKMKVFKSR